MKIIDLKEWVMNLPIHLDDFNLVLREVSTIEGDDGEELTIYKDTPITYMAVDEENKEAFVTDEESAQLILEQYIDEKE